MTDRYSRVCLVISMVFLNTKFCPTPQPLALTILQGSPSLSSISGRVCHANSVAKWLRWTNLGVTPPLSDWKVVGLDPTSGMSRVGFFIKGRNFNGFP